MASGQTTNYGLNQWASEDNVLRQEFNSDNIKVDGILNELEQELSKKGNCSIFMGEYTGTGKAGAEYPNQLTFPFVPLVVVIIRKDGMYASHQAIALHGQEHFCDFNCGSSDSSNTCTWKGCILSWYSASINSYIQLNGENDVYQYVGIG